MIPVQLTIEGLYSYQERQTIDFTNLIDAGLFGIFGAVGSGKSSILEAITYALYGETERLNVRDKRTYNMMNLKSNRSYIEFDFINHENKTFRITRDFKRNSKRFEDVKSPVVVFSELKDEVWVPLNHTSAEELLGLSYSNFKRTIIIPQGQFKEFIELGAKDRTQMMKEIFNLHRFDLQDKVAVLVKKNQSEIDQLQGKLSGFEEVSEDYIKELQLQLIELDKIAEKHQVEYTEANENFQKLKALKNDFESLKQKKISFEQLSVDKVLVDERKVQLEKYELIFNAFNQLLLDQSKVQKEIELKNATIESQKNQLQLIENQITEVSNQIKEIQADFDVLPIKRKQEIDLEFIIQILTFLEEIKVLRIRTEKGLEKVVEVKQNEELIEKNIKTLESDIKSITKNKIDSTILMEVGNWFNQNQNIQLSIQKQEQKLADSQKQIETLIQELANQNIKIDSFENDFKSKFEELETQKNAYEKLKHEIEVKKKISEYAHSLHDGKPCPLCGSENHPNVVEIDDVTTELHEISKLIAHVISEHEKLRIQQQNVQSIFNKKQLIEEQLVLDKNNFTELVNQFNTHQEGFVWKDFDSKDFANFEERKSASLEIEKLITEKNYLLSEQRELFEKERVNLEKFTKALEQFKLEEAQKESQIQQNKQNLKILNFEDFNSETIENVQNQLQNLKLFIQKTELDYTRFNQNLNDLKPKLASQKASIESLEKQIIELNQELVAHASAIEKALIQNQFDSLEVVHQTLQLNLNISQIRQELEDFRVKYETLKNSIEELEVKLKSISFDDEAYQIEEEKLNVITSNLKEATEAVTKLKTGIEILKESFEAKKDLLKEMDKLQKRAANLAILKNMFNAAGFVQYVSSIYLKQLCDNANIRFHRMTRNQLSLQINENNDFEIVDYLNEGRARSVKTLSGGQAFQVSLSLALALAESVQSNSKAERNFFFIDEGFGTQDAEAVNIVFETLNHLHKENRIVGIISHIEELKERIPVSLNIVKDEEKGSKITMI
ncbi:MAG: SMC family ATPase [Weeksellaceae bacterium]|nr:SMC family ATPase [Weeksellaceae bacterium]